MKRIVRASGMFLPIVALLVTGLVAPASANGGGFDQYGYNDGARIFNGTGSSWCLAGGSSADCLNIPSLGDFSNDHLVMKWNAAWDACNANGYDNPTYCAGAWVTNEWNGMVPGGSQWTEHVKIIWVGSAGVDSSYWVNGGYSIWGSYEAIQDQGMAPGHIHFVAALATPNGLGASK